MVGVGAGGDRVRIISTNMDRVNSSSGGAIPVHEFLPSVPVPPGPQIRPRPVLPPNWYNRAPTWYGTPPIWYNAPTTYNAPSTSVPTPPITPPTNVAPITPANANLTPGSKVHTEPRPYSRDLPVRISRRQHNRRHTRSASVTGISFFHPGYQMLENVDITPTRNITADMG